MSDASPDLPDGQDILSADHRSAHLLAENLHVVLGDRVVLHDVSLKVSHGERVGLIGENGRGKSTLLRALAGELAPQRGDVLRAVTGRVGFLPQQPDFPADFTLDDVLARATARFEELSARMRAAEERMSGEEGDLDAVLAEYGRLQEEFDRRGGWELGARIGEVLDVFGLTGIGRDRAVRTLSGGERSRLALAALVLDEPAGLLLDEPTNHLDDRAVDWLVQWLAAYRGPCLIASHDRALLDTAVTAIVDLDGPRGATVRYGGGYRDYLAERAAARERWWQRYREWSKETAEARRRVQRAATSGRVYSGRADNDKLSYDAAGSGAERAVARTGRAAQLHLQRLLGEAVPRPPEPLDFAPPHDAQEAGPVPDPADGVLLRATGVSVGDVLRDADLELAAGSRYLISGPNGAGKSTLLSVLVGERAPDAGEVARAPGLRIGYLPQDSDFRAERRPLLDAFAARRAAHVEDAAAELTRFGLFEPGDFATPANRLSIGQWRRLDLALLFAERPHLLLLDEPTNHLSLVLVEQLLEAVERFTGPVVTVTHDRALRERHRDRLLELSGGRLARP
ncbi:ABC-F family ATP-binding cassette domain-containing protein [Streptomyces sp. SID14478]|uniref:ABC-F family ATP-binding cassette domain-containing protein n=1 Tax=Streptomyces sp. SID14478 TaxID=2706073 RepID=UPI0013DFA677|nr:ABC-F family ATP-binding cassette domain-containing protein [Streptomyces sp. SID14478]NEB80367.1 ABC-F family ATP-binding cassette domain-containing protein [Streptomyces sp. SID14478]